MIQEKNISAETYPTEEGACHEDEKAVGVVAALALCCAVAIAAPVTARAASVRLTPKGSFENNRFHLTYTIPSDWKVEDDAVIDPSSDLFDLMLATAKSQGYKIDYYPSMPGDSNECTVTVVNGNADAYFYYVAGSFSLTTDANSTVTNEDDGPASGTSPRSTLGTA